MNTTVIGLSIVLFAGAFGSATLLPMKFVRHWPWEQSWLVFALHAYLIFPLAVAWFTVPNLRSVYGAASAVALLEVALFGLGWGLSVVLLGLAVARAGLAVSNAVILGCSISLGSLVPLLTQEPATAWTGDALRVVAANGLLLAGVLWCALAGHWRDRQPAARDDRTTTRGGGLALCFAAGLLTPLLNFALAAGAPITEQARLAGAAPYQAANALWGLAVGTGSIPSLVYCTALLRINRSWHGLAERLSAINAALCVGMGALFIASTIGYGAGAMQMGTWGPVIGWPVYVSALLIGNSLWGWLTGEWRLAPRKAVGGMLLGVGLQVVGIVLLFSVVPA